MFARLLPSSGLTRRLSLQAALFAVGQGSFVTGSMVFFTQIVGLAAAQVGLGLSIAGAAAFAAAVPLGRVADRVGHKRMWALAACLHGGLYLAYPGVRGFGLFVGIVVALELASTAGVAARGAYLLNALPREERVKSLAYMRSALNVGFTVGALMGGLALAAGSDEIIRAVPVATSVVLLVNAALIARLPAVSSEVPSAGPLLATLGSLRNKGFLALNVFVGILSTNQVLLNVVIPLWLVQETDAPRWLLAWLFATNTVLVVALQVVASRGAHTVSGAVKTTWRSAACLAASCVVVMVTDSTTGWVTIGLIWLGHVVLTGAELFGSAAGWGFSAELSDPTRRGEYQGMVRVGSTLGTVWAPAVYTYLAIYWQKAGWLAIAAAVLLAAAAARPAARAAERYLAEHTGSAGSPAGKVGAA